MNSKLKYMQLKPTLSESAELYKFMGNKIQSKVNPMIELCVRLKHIIKLYDDSKLTPRNIFPSVYKCKYAMP